MLLLKASFSALCSCFQAASYDLAYLCLDDCRLSRAALLFVALCDKAAEIFFLRSFSVLPCTWSAAKRALKKGPTSNCS